MATMARFLGLHCLRNAAARVIVRSLLIAVLSQDVYTGLSTYAILGELKTKQSVVTVSHCFMGLGFRAEACEHVADNWYDINPGMASVPFHWSVKFSGQGEYCVECCDNSRLEADSDESWKLKCSTDQTSFTQYVEERVGNL